MEKYRIVKETYSIQEKVCYVVEHKPKGLKGLFKAWRRHIGYSNEERAKKEIEFLKRWNERPKRTILKI